MIPLNNYALKAATIHNYQLAAILDPPSWISRFPQVFSKMPKLHKQ